MSKVSSPDCRHSALRRRSVVTIVGAALMALAACGDDSEPDTNAENDKYSAIQDLKVCELVDLSPVTETLGADFSEGPNYVAPGTGRSLEAPACLARVDLPDIPANGDGDPISPGTSQVELTVLPYRTEQQAEHAYDLRVAHATDEPTPLTGDWTQGATFTNTVPSLTDAVIQSGPMLVVVEFMIPSFYQQEYPFTPEDITALETSLVTDLYAATNSAIN